MRQIALVAPVLGWLVGCASASQSERDRSATGTHDSLTAVVSQLKLHMQDDTYRFDRAVGPGGNDVYSVALWKLDRLAAQRARAESEWQNADYVIEFARGKALERLRRYQDAAHAYSRVKGSGSLLGDAAAERLENIEKFAAASAAPERPFESAEEELIFVEGRLAVWRSISLAVRGTPQEPLAREEAEAWEVLRVDGLERAGRLVDAIGACRTLIETHRESKLFGKHLLRLGDLYADAARRERVRARTRIANLDVERYDSLLDQAFSAYELAGEDHKPALRREARTRIEALLAVHEEVKGHAH